MCGLRRPSSCPTSPWRSLSSRLAGEPSSGTQGVSCCFSTSLSPGSVSAHSTPHASTLARLPCAHLRAETHSNRYLLIQRSCVRSYAPSVQRIDARGFGKVKRQTARRHGINIYNQIPLAGGAAIEVVEALQTRRTICALLRTGCGLASRATSLRDSRGSAAASGAASAALPSVAPGGAAQPSPKCSL